MMHQNKQCSLLILSCPTCNKTNIFHKERAYLYHTKTKVKMYFLTWKVFTREVVLHWY